MTRRNEVRIPSQSNMWLGCWSHPELVRKIINQFTVMVEGSLSLAPAGGSDQTPPPLHPPPSVFSTPRRQGATVRVRRPHVLLRHGILVVAVPAPLVPVPLVPLRLTPPPIPSRPNLLSPSRGRPRAHSVSRHVACQIIHRVPACAFFVTSVTRGGSWDVAKSAPPPQGFQPS